MSRISFVSGDLILRFQRGQSGGPVGFEPTNRGTNETLEPSILRINSTYEEQEEVEHSDCYGGYNDPDS